MNQQLAQSRRAGQRALLIALRLNAPLLAPLGVALGGLAANVVSGLVLYRHSARSLNVRGAYLHVIGDALGSLGVAAAAIVMLSTGWFLADPLISVLIGLLILYSAWRLLRESLE